MRKDRASKLPLIPDIFGLVFCVFVPFFVPYLTIIGSFCVRFVVHLGFVILSPLYATVGGKFSLVFYGAGR